MSASRAGGFPRALPTTRGPHLLIDDVLLQRVQLASRRSPRGRIILPLHPTESDAVNRMLNALQPGSYIQPHRHLHPPKAEAVVVLRGALQVLLFDADGVVTQRLSLAAGTGPIGIDIREGVFHTLFATAPDTVIFEVKAGPYLPASDKDFATWAPAEGSPEAAAYLESLSAPR